jgi:hypothetical protein
VDVIGSEGGVQLDGLQERLLHLHLRVRHTRRSVRVQSDLAEHVPSVRVVRIPSQITPKVGHDVEGPVVCDRRSHAQEGGLARGQTITVSLCFLLRFTSLGRPDSVCPADRLPQPPVRQRERGVLPNRLF